ncbi:MAG: HAD family phosphatase [Muribaculaceae bacterium]|nr:HAD family phosphatase [Muribaculaceae bacterium]
MNKFKAALFDLDGVLIDTEGTYTEFWNEIAKQYGKVPTFAYDIKGTTLTDILTTHFPDPETQKKLIAQIYEFEANMQYRLFPGAAEFLHELKRRGVRCAIVTSSDKKKMASLALQQPSLAAGMDAVVIADDVQRSKPDPQGYLLAAKRLGICPDDCVVFEDSLQGLEAGRRSGAFVVGLTTTNPIDKVAPLADLTIASIASADADTIGFLSI